MNDERVSQENEVTLTASGGRVIVYDTPEELERLRAALDETGDPGVTVFIPRARMEQLSSRKAGHHFLACEGKKDQ